MRAAADIILSVENLSKAFQGVQALAPLSFTIGYGITAFIGPNGAGKTTLFNLLSGIYGPSSGSISHRGEDITALPVAERAQRGIQRTDNRSCRTWKPFHAADLPRLVGAAVGAVGLVP